MEILTGQQQWRPCPHAGEHRGEFQAILIDFSLRPRRVSLRPRRLKALNRRDRREHPRSSQRKTSDKSAEAGAPKGLPEVGPFHFHDPAHLMEAGTHALSNAIA